jgi:hypothetical protein
MTTCPASSTSHRRISGESYSGRSTCKGHDEIRENVSGSWLWEYRSWNKSGGSKEIEEEAGVEDKKTLDGSRTQ